MSQTPWRLCAQGAAFYFVRSAEHDIADLHRLAHDAQSKTVTTLDCSRPSHTKPACPCCHFPCRPLLTAGFAGHLGPPAPPKWFKERVAAYGLIGVAAASCALWARKRSSSWSK